MIQRPVKSAFWLACLFALVMASLPHPYPLLGDTNDKVQHTIAFVTLSILAAWAYPRTSLVGIFFGLALFGGFIELVQMIPALHRDADLLDWGTDVVAVAATLFIVIVIRRLLGRPIRL